jgi:hypothetical protein
MDSLFYHVFELFFKKERDHLVELGCANPTLNLCSLVQEYYNMYATYPSIEELAVYQYRPCEDHCDYYVPMEYGLPILMHTIKEYGVIVTCRILYIFHVFYFTEGRYPNIAEIEAELDEPLSDITPLMHDSVDEFWRKKSSGVDIGKIPSKVLSETVPYSCAICQDEMTANQSVLQLPCSHMFHTESDTCTGIEAWLSKVDQCPLCKHPVM